MVATHLVCWYLIGIYRNEVVQLLNQLSNANGDSWRQKKNADTLYPASWLTNHGQYFQLIKISKTEYDKKISSIMYKDRVHKYMEIETLKKGDRNSNSHSYH